MEIPPAELPPGRSQRLLVAHAIGPDKHLKATVRLFNDGCLYFLLAMLFLARRQAQKLLSRTFTNRAVNGFTEAIGNTPLVSTLH